MDVDANIDASRENATSNDDTHWKARKRPLLYESKGKDTRRRRTETDIQMPKSLLSSDQELLVDERYSSPCEPSIISDSLERYESTFTKRRNNRRRQKEADRLRRQTVAVDGIYHARRAVSVEQLPMSDDSDSPDVQHKTIRADMDDATDSEDEFFLATDFVTPLPRSLCTQSVDYLDSIIREDVISPQELRRRCTSEYDVFDTQSSEYQTFGLQKDVSLPSSTNSLFDFAIGKADADITLESDFDLESLPPESLVGSSAENMCPSPLGFFGDIDDWTPPHDPNVIHSAREARDFITRRDSGGLSARDRCKSETYLLKRQRSLSFSMLSDEVYMDDIECHTSYRRKLRAALGLEDAHSSADNLNTSLTFRLPHTRTNEQLHTRLRRVLSSVSINDPLFSDHSDNETHNTRYNRRRGQRTHWRTKSMPSDVNEFIQSFNSNCNSSSQYYERSKSAEILNHLGKQSAFSIYNEDEVDDKQSSIHQLDDEDEIFVDSPLVVDYQLGRRQSLPLTPSTSSSSEDCQHLDVQSNTRNCSQSKDFDSHDEEVKEALHQEILPYNVVRAKPVLLATPEELDGSSIVHATPIILGTPCQLHTSVEQKRELSPLTPHQADVGVQSLSSSMHRQAIKPLMFDAHNTDSTQISPHDSLAIGSTSSKGGTGYFLQFNNLDHKTTSPSKREQKPTSPVKKSAASPKKPVSAPKKTTPLPKRAIPSPKKPSSPSKNPPSPARKPVNSSSKTISAKKSVASKAPTASNNNSTPSKAQSSTVKTPVTSPKKQGPPVKPKPNAKAKSKIPVVGPSYTHSTRGRVSKPHSRDGFRTRSVSPKVLKREDILTTQQDQESVITSVADQCSKLLKNLETDRSHISKTLPVPKMSSLQFEPEPASVEAHEINIEEERLSVGDIRNTTKPTSLQCSESIADDNAVAQSYAQPMASDYMNKRTNNCSNNNFSDTGDSAKTSRLADSEVFIDLVENNQVNNTTSHCPTDESSSQVTNVNGVERLEEVEDSTSSYRILYTSEASEYQALPSTTASIFKVFDPFGEDCHKSSSGCQEPTYTTNSEQKNSSATLATDYWNDENEPERDTNVDHGMVDGEALTIHSTQSHSDEEVDLEGKQKQQVDPTKELSTNETSTMASSWMDRLKEDLDNDDEWLSDEEDFQREQEAQLRAAAQRKALAEVESLSDDDETPEQYESRVGKKLEKERDWSDEDVGFQGRNAPLRKSMSRSSYSAEEYSSEEELMMSAAPQQHREPGQEEMDMMVKKNLAYVNSKELDQMDILTSDLDTPPQHLQLPDGVGDFVRADEAADMYADNNPRGMDAKEDSDNEGHIEVVGELKVVGDSEITADHRDVQRWAGNVDEYTEVSEPLAKPDTADKEATRAELISALAEDLKESDQRDMADQVESLGPGDVEEEVLSPTNKYDLEAGVTSEDVDEQLHQPNTTDDSKDGSQQAGEDYSTQVIRPNRNRGWRKQLSQKMNEWEDELPSPSRTSGDVGLDAEAVTSFMSEEDEDGEDVKPGAGHSSLERTKSTEGEIREKVEDSMQDKIRDWKNMTAESVAGQVDEWQSLGNFNIPNSSKSHEPQSGRRRAHEDAADESVPAEKRRDLERQSERQESGEYADINTVVRQTSAYDGDVEGVDEREDIADSDGAMEDDGEGYVSDSSSQDTVRERSMRHQSLPTATGDESLDSPAVSNAEASEEPGYVEILGGEEPPDEWMNLGTRRERISSSSSDGSGFQYIAADPSLRQSERRSPVPMEQREQDVPRLANRSSRERLSTPPIDLPVSTHTPVEELMQQIEYTDRQNSAPPELVVEPLTTDFEGEAVVDVSADDVAAEPISHSVDEVLTEDEDVVEVIGKQILEERSSPEPAAEEAEETRSLPRSETSSESEPEETETADADQGPEPSTRKDSFDRVEKLREEMRSASTSGKSNSFDLQMTRQSRSADRFTERMISFEKSKAMREKKTPTPAGLGGKFDAVFSRFEAEDRGRGRDSASPLTGRSKSTGPSTRRTRDRSAEREESIKPTNSRQVKSEPKETERTKSKSSLSRSETVSQQPRTESKSRRVERSKTFDTGVPNRSPGGSKVIARMAKFGQQVYPDLPRDQQTVTTKNSDTERFERHTVDNKSRSKSKQPNFDVDIRISREPLENDSSGQRSHKGSKTAAITVGRDKVKVEQIDKRRRVPSEDRREEYLNVWDTEVPVKDGNKKIISPKRLHVTSVNKKIKPSSSQENSDESKLRRRPSSLQHEEVSVTVRPQQAATQSSSRRSRKTDSPAETEQSRMRSSIALQPTDEVIEVKRVSRQHAEPQRKSRGPERDSRFQKADSLEDLRSGSLVARCKGKFDSEDQPALYLPIDQAKAYSNRRDDPYNDRHETMSDAVRDLAGAYDQMEEVEDYDIGYSRESLEYTRKWIENNETTPDDMPMHRNGDIIQPHGRDRVADPRRDDANYRRMQQANKRDVPRHYIMPSQVTMSSASPEPSVISDRGRARSTDSNRPVKVGRPKGRSRSLPRRKPAKAIADRASVFTNPTDEPPMSRPDIEEHIRAASAGKSMQSNPSRRSASPRPVSQKEKLANRRSMPAQPAQLPAQPIQQQRDPNEEEQGSPRAASKGVALMIELYNKNKAGDSVLADVDEQTLASVDDGMFRQPGMPTSPVDEAAISARAWKAWRGQVDRPALEQKVENAYNRHTHHSGPPIKRESKPPINSGWQQRAIHEEPITRPVHVSQTYRSAPQASPPRPVKSNVAADMQRRGWSTSPPAPAIPHRGYSAEPGHPNVYNSNQPPDTAFDNYKQQTLQRFRQEEQYATVQKSGRPEPPRQLPLQAPNTFDQALLMQAPPPKPERLYNKAEPWEAYPPNEYPTTNSLQGYQPKPTSQYPGDPRAPGDPRDPRTPVDPRDPRASARYPDERQQFAAYPQERQPSQRDPRYRDYPPPPQPQRQAHPGLQARYDDRGYPAHPPPPQTYREPGYAPPPKQNYPTSQPYRDTGYDTRPYGPGNEPFHHGYPDQTDSYRQPPRKEVRYPHEQPPRGPIPDPRYVQQSNGIRSPPPQQADPRYGPFDPKMETSGRPPRRTNSVPNIKQQVQSPTKGQPSSQPYNPRYHDQYMEDRQRSQQQQPNTQHGSLPRSSKKDKSKKNKDKAGLPEFIPIQYATGKHPKSAPQNGYGGHPKHPQNNNYPPAPNNNRYAHPADHAYAPNGYPPYHSNGHPAYPPGHGYGHPGYPHDDPYAQRTRPGVGVVYNPDLGVSDF